MEFQHSIENFVGGYVGFVIEVVVGREFFVDVVFFYCIEVSPFVLVL